MRNKKRWLAMMLAAAMTITSVGVSPLGGIDAVYAGDEQDPPAEATYDYYTGTVKIPNQVWTGKVPDLSKVDELASISVSLEKGGTANTTLFRGRDYTVKASTSKVGAAEAIFTGIGNYAGKKIQPVKFEIVAPEEVANYTASVDTSKFVYNGKAFDADTVKANTIVLKNGDETVPCSSEPSTAELGKYSIAITRPTGVSQGTAAKAGEVYGVKITVRVKDGKDLVIYDEKVTIAKRNIATLDIKKLTSGLNGGTYDATEKKPTISSNMSYTGDSEVASIVIPKEDITIKSYKDNINAGDAKAVIEIKSTSENYTGTAEVLFKINKASFKNVTFIPNTTSVEYNGKVQKPNITGRAVFTKTFKEVPVTDYKVVYDSESKEPNEGETSYQVRLKAADNVRNFMTTGDSGENADKETTPVDAYKITKADLSKATVKLPNGVYTAGTDFDENAFEVVCNGRKLTADEYTVVNDNGGKTSTVGAKIEATIKPAEGSTKYTGSIKYTFTVVAAEMAKEYKATTSSIVYDGIAKKPSAAILGTLSKVGDDGADTLTENDYEVVSWENNTNASKEAIANIRGKGKFEGRTAKVKFTISKFDIGAEESESPIYTAEVSGIKSGSYYIGGSVDFTSVKLIESEKKTIATLTPSDCEVVANGFDAGILTEVIVKGKGNYEGELTVGDLSVEATNVDLTNAVVTGSIPTGLKSYSNGDILKKYIKVTVDGKEIESSALEIEDDSIACATAGKKAGDLGSEITFEVSSNDGQIIGKKSVKLAIVQRNIADLKDSVSLWYKNTESSEAEVGKTTYTYNGAENKPTVKVNPKSEDDFRALNEGTDFTVSYSNNINAGTATVTLTGKGDYKGTVSTTFTIGKCEFSDSIFELDTVPANLREYKPGTPNDISSKLSIKAKDKTKYVFTSSDYTIELGQNEPDVPVDSPINYTVKFNKSSNNYKAGATTEFNVEVTVVPKTVTSADITLEKDTVEYIDVEEPSYSTPTVKSIKVDGEKIDAKNFEAKIVVPQNKVKPDAGKEPYVEIKFKDNYAGVIRKTIQLTPIEIDLSKVLLKVPSAADCVFGVFGTSGKEVKATSLDPKVPSKSFKIEYKDKDGNVLKSAPTKVGKYTATVVAADNYASKTPGKSVSFEITAPEFSKEEMDKITFTFNPVSYAGTLSEAPTISSIDAKNTGLKADDFEVVSFDTDWDGKLSADTGHSEAKYKVVLKLKDTANGIYDGTIESKFAFKKGNLSNLAKAFSIDDQVYTGEALTPSVKVAEGTNIDPEWITVQYYKDNINASKKTAYAQITVEPPVADKYYGGTKYSAPITFDIKAASIETATVEGIKDAEYTGKAITQDIDVTTADGLVLTLGKDYKVSYANNVNPGTATVTISGFGNYSGKIVKTFKITKKETPVVKVDISKATVSGLKTVTYNGKAFKPAVKVVVNGKTLVLNKDYKVAYSNNIKPGTAKVVITGIGSYKGTVTKTFVIKKAAQSITKAVVKKTFKASSLKKKAATFKINAKAKGKITYKKTSGSKNITVSKSGTVTVKKGTKKGTYTIKVKITAAATSYYLSKSVTKTIKVVVK